MHSVLHGAVQTYFDQRDFTNKDVLVDAWRRFAAGRAECMHSINSYEGALTTASKAWCRIMNA
jgi:hypothetical protein